MHRLGFILLCLAISLTPFAGKTAESDLVRHAKELHSRYVSLDSHTDAPLVWDEKGYTLAGKHPNCVTLDKMNQGHLDAVYLAAYVASDYNTRGKKGVYPLNGTTFANRRAETLKLLNLSLSEIAKNKNRCGLAVSARDVRNLKKQGKHAMLLGVENGIGIGHDIDFIDTLAKMGVTYITLTHVYDNQLCTSSSKTRNRKSGLTETGRKAVKRMNERGIIVDLSHCSEKTFYDVLALSTKPVVCTHSGVKSLRKHDRNLTDDQLRALARNGGVVQIVAYHGFIAPSKTASLKQMVDHIDHAVKVAGVDHVGIGTDFDGGGKLTGLKDESEFINITVELLRRGYSDDDIKKILGANFLRVLEANRPK